MGWSRRGEGRRLPLTVFAMHVSAGGGWGGSGGRRGGAVQDSGCLSDCLTGKLHPSYLSENRGIDRSEKELPPQNGDGGEGNRQKKTWEIPMTGSIGFALSGRGSEGSAGARTDAGVSVATTNKPQSERSREPKFRWDVFEIKITERRARHPGHGQREDKSRWEESASSHCHRRQRRV